MTTDEKLLELAAKAAGLKIIGTVDKMIAQPDHRASGFVVRNDRGGDSCWNPLTDDGDALRLAVRLRIAVNYYERPHKTECVCAAWIYGATGGAEHEELGGDPYAATRRAIVRAAAEIGKAMP